MRRVVAIHGECGFVPRWRDVAISLGNEVVTVNGYSSGVMDRLRECDLFLWHISQDEETDLQFARSILLSAEGIGVNVYPNHATCWHFDDKIAQKYLLEAIRAPLATTWVFYSLEEARSFLDQTVYPLVFKLRRGAGSVNVRLVRDRGEGLQLVSRMFGHGMSPFPAAERLRRLARHVNTHGRAGGISLAKIGRVMRRFVRQTLRSPREQGYVLFQSYVPDNDHDTRVTIIGDRRFCFFRGVRDNDFRASGSGRIRYLAEGQIPMDAVEIAADISDRLGFQSMAYDFVRDPVTGDAILLEMSHVFNDEAIHNCPGFMLRGGSWCARSVWPQDAILEDLLT